MSHKAAIAAAVLAVVGTPAVAQSVTGGELSIEYSVPTDGSDFGGTTYSGGLEVGITRQFALGIDVSGYRPDNIDTDFSSATLHGVYHLSDVASAGLFFGQDYTDGASTNVYGLEGGAEVGNGIVVGGYLGKIDGDASDGTLFGVDGAYALQNGFSVVGDFDLADSDGATIRQIALGGEYTMQAGPSLYAKVGNLSAEEGAATSDQTFITLGAEVAFGAKRGTTFDQRSFFEILPGF